MTQDKTDPSPLQIQFRRAAQGACRPTRSYDVLKNLTPAPEAPTIKRSDNLSDKVAKSYAQVESSVRPHVVSPNSGGLKSGRERPHRLMARFSDAEKEFVQSKADMECLSINEYIRASVLDNGYTSSLDPVHRKLLLELSRELGLHGHNLGLIAEHLYAGNVNPYDGERTLEKMFTSLLAAHNAVRRALAEGETYE